MTEIAEPSDAFPPGTAHPRCREAGEHVCQEPSGRACIEQPCDQPAGTRWGPYWCPDHDLERIDRVSRSLERLAGGLPEGAEGPA